MAEKQCIIKRHYSFQACKEIGKIVTAIIDLSLWPLFDNIPIWSSGRYLRHPCDLATTNHTFFTIMLVLFIK